MADTVNQPTQPLSPQYRGGAYGQVWWCRGPEPVSCSFPGGSAFLASVKSGLITAAYASVQDLFDISVGEDQNFDYASNAVAVWLRVGAAKINEFLGQRFNVPLTVWSDTVVWANTEIAYVGITRKRGINSEALMADFRAREDAVLSWLKMARDHELTPDQRLSIQDQPVQALRYLSQPGRGWERDFSVSYSYSRSGSIGRFRGRY